MPSIGENTAEKEHQKIEFYQSKFPTRDHPKKYQFLKGVRDSTERHKIKRLDQA